MTEPGVSGPSRAEIEARINERADEDEDFRAELLTDPRAALSGLFGVEIPETFRLRVVEEASDETVVVLRSPELSRDELTTVAAGMSWHEWVAENLPGFG